MNASPTTRWRSNGRPRDTLTKLGVIAATVLSAACAVEGGELVGSSSAALCTPSTFSAAPGSPAPAGALVELNATGGCDAGETPEYLFLYRGAGAQTPIGGWGAPSASWDTTGLPSGRYSLVVQSRAVGTTTIATRKLYYLLGAVCPTATLSITPGANEFGLAATASCVGGATPEFRFLSQPQTGGPATEIRSWGSSPNATFSTLGLAPGTYALRVDVRGTGNFSGYDVSESKSVLIGEGCDELTLGTSPSSPQDLGTLVGINAVAECDGSAVPEYRFFLREPGAASSEELRGWGPGTFGWDTSGLASGRWLIDARARAVDNLSTIESRIVQPYLLGDVCQGVALSTTPPSPSMAGAPVTLNASATCRGAAVPEYLFRIKRPGEAFAELRGWGGPSVPWDTVGATPGQYTLSVYARGQGNLSDFESKRDIRFDLQPGPPTTTYVELTGNDANDCRTVATACRTLQAAFNKVVAGGTIVVGTGRHFPGSKLFVAKNVTIEGADDATTFIDGSAAINLIEINPGITATLRGLTLTRARPAIINRGELDLEEATLSENTGPQGGALFNGHIARLRTVVVVGNSVASNSGGGIYNEHTLEIEDSVIANNSTPFIGGGVFALGSFAAPELTRTTLRRTSVTENRAAAGGGVGNWDGTLVVEDSSIDDNHTSPEAGCTAPANGGGGAIWHQGELDVRRSTLNGNDTCGAGAAVISIIAGRFEDVLVSNNRGSEAIFAQGLDAELRLVRTTVTGTVSDLPFRGDGVWANDKVTRCSIENSTISGNLKYGLGVATGAICDVRYSTITQNARAAVVNDGEVRLTGTILEAPGLVCDLFAGGGGIYTSHGDNIASDASCDLVAAGDMPSTAPLLAPLADNGGFAPTHALLPGSPALNTALDTTCPSDDQRRISRPQGAACDIGSYEQVP
jgi:hypothetical protein